MHTIQEAAHRNVHALLQQEQEMMGRDATLVGYSVCETGSEIVQTVVYDLDPLVTGHGTMHERRVALFVNGKSATSNVVRTWWD